MKKIIFSIMLILTSGMAMAEIIPNQPTPAPIKDQQIIPHTERQENQEQRYTIEVIYPQIESKNLSENEQLFNKAVKDLVSQEVQQFKKYVIADIPHMQTLPEEMRKNRFSLDYALDIVKPAENVFIMSMRLTSEGYQGGRAHPYHNTRVLNFNLATGKVIELSDLFKKNAKYLETFAEYSNKKLNEKLEDKTFVEEGSKPTLKNYKNWNLESDDILITFDEYQVASYVYGPQEVAIPYKELEAILSPEAPIYPCLKDPESCKIGS